MNESDFQTLGLIGSILSIETIGILTRKGVLTMDEEAEIFDRCLLNVETRIGNAPSAALPVLQAARQSLEAALAQIDSQRSSPPRRNQ
jgi:hypothetical protein